MIPIDHLVWYITAHIGVGGMIYWTSSLVLILVSSTKTFVLAVNLLTIPHDFQYFGNCRTHINTDSTLRSKTILLGYFSHHIIWLETIHQLQSFTQLPPFPVKWSKKQTNQYMCYNMQTHIILCMNIYTFINYSIVSVMRWEY